ncbi:MAG TPA: hypothetical protein VMZ53_18210 [Kofleriaceae bacterium]|nr:hypothetical protein [Kofleriaceae bacterium]
MKRAITTTIAACCLAATLVVAAGCGSKKSGKSPEVTGLAAVPASAQVVIVTDVARVLSSPIIERAIDQLMLRDADLAARWQKLRDTCKIDMATISHVALAIGPKTGDSPGTGPVLMVVTGKLVEADLATCVRAMVGQGGGQLIAKEAYGHTLYQAVDANRTMYFAFGRPDTVVLGSNEKYVTEALGTGTKVSDDPEMKRWISRADQKAPVWAAGRVDDRVKTGLVRVTNGQLKEGPQAMLVALDPTNGAKIEVSSVMASDADAKTLESYAKTQLGALAMAAQAKRLGRVVEKVQISSENETVRFKADLGMDEVNLLISVLDGEAPREQISPPPASGSAIGSGSGL